MNGGGKFCVEGLMNEEGEVLHRLVLLAPIRIAKRYRIDPLYSAIPSQSRN